MTLLDMGQLENVQLRDGKQQAKRLVTLRCGREVILCEAWGDLARSLTSENWQMGAPYVARLAFSLHDYTNAQGVQCKKQDIRLLDLCQL